MAAASGIRLRATPAALAAGAGAIVVAASVTGKATYLILLLVVLPAAYVLRRPQNGILLLAALAPMDGMLQIAHVPRVASYWKEGLVAVIFAITFIVEPEGDLGRRRLPRWTSSFVLFAAIGFASAVAHLGTQALLGLKLEFFYALLAVAAWRRPLDAKDRDRLVTIIMVTGLINAVYSVFQELLGAARLNALGYQYNTTITTSGGVLKAFGTVGSAHGMGLFAAVVVLVGLTVALDDPARTRNRAFLWLMPIYTAALLLSLTRAAWTAAAVGVLYLGIRHYRRLLLVIPLSVVIVIWTPANILGPALSAKSSQERFSTWTAVPSLVANHPLGEGMGSAGSAVDKVNQGGPFASTSTAPVIPSAVVSVALPDNYYVLVIAELGVLGLWAFLMFFLGVFGEAHSAALLRLPGDDIFPEVLAVTSLGSIVAALSETTLELYPADLFFWLIAGVGAATIAAETVRRASGAGGRPGALTTTLVGARPGPAK